MKTLKIAALGVSALGFAALPVLGAVAQDANIVTQVQETVTAIIEPTCGIYETFSITAGTGAVTATAPTNHAFSKTLVNGQLWNSDNLATGEALGHKYTVYCNDHTGWHVTATGAQTGDNLSNKMVAKNGSAPIATGAAVTSGTTAAWAFRVDVTEPASNSGITASYAQAGTTKYYDVPASATTVLSATQPTVIPTSFTTGYQVYIGTETPADEYTGKVTYTLYNTPSATTSGPAVNPAADPSSSPSD